MQIIILKMHNNFHSVIVFLLCAKLYCIEIIFSSHLMMFIVMLLKESPRKARKEIIYL